MDSHIHPQSGYMVGISGLVVVAETEVYSVWTTTHYSRERMQRRMLFESVRSLDWDIARVKSRGERERLGKQKDGTLTYGEVPYDAMDKILEAVHEIRVEDLDASIHDYENPFKEDVFIDLGSGAGRPGIAAATLRQFKSIHGVEILEDLHLLALQSLQEYESQAQRVIGESDDHPGITRELSFHLGSIFDLETFDWVNVKGVILANSTCFSPDMFSRMADLAVDTHPDNIIVTFSNDLEDKVSANEKRFEILRTQRLKMSWGEADVFFHRVKKDPSLKA